MSVQRNKLLSLLAASAAALLAKPASAQDSVQLPVPPRATGPTKLATPPGAGYLAQRFNIPLEEAARRINLQDRISALVARLQGGSDPEFAGVWVQHEPTFKIVIAYTNPTEAKLSGLNIDAELRSLVELRTLVKARRAVLAEQDRVLALLPQTIPFVSYIEDETAKIFVRVETAALQNQVRSLLAAAPGLPAVEVVLGPVPKPVQTGAQPGDWIYGGHWYYATNQIPAGANEQDYRGCTFSFPARLGTTEGILTAGHCNPGRGAVKSGTGYWHYINNHWVELPAPTIARWKYGTKYDYQFHATRGYDPAGRAVYYENKSGEPNALPSGHFFVNGMVGYYGQTKGMVSCKSGWNTGLTCATINNGAYTYNGAKGWIELYRPSGAVLARGGDSGGGVFSPADSQGYIKAYGITTAAADYSDGSSVMVYMPIDYIDDESPISVITTVN